MQAGKQNNVQKDLPICYFEVLPIGVINNKKVAINEVLPLKASRRDGISSLKSFWGLKTPAT